MKKPDSLFSTIHYLPAPEPNPEPPVDPVQSPVPSPRLGHSFEIVSHDEFEKIVAKNYLHEGAQINATELNAKADYF